MQLGNALSANMFFSGIDFHRSLSKMGAQLIPGTGANQHDGKRDRFAFTGVSSR
jgi:hypothetical protein